MRRLARMLTLLLAAIGAAAAAITGALLVVAVGRAGPPDLPQRLVLDTAVLAEHAGTQPRSALPALGGGRPAWRDLLRALRRAESDPRVAGVLLDLCAAQISMADAQDLRDAVRRLRESGRRVVAWADTYGEFQHGTIPYYVASAADSVWVQPAGQVAATGFSETVPFLREALRRAGVAAEFAARGEYKTAVSTFTEEGYTAAHAEASRALLDDLAGQAVAAIAEARRLDPAAVRAAMDEAPLLAEEARRAGLVDHVGHRRAAMVAALAGADGARAVPLADYLAALPRIAVPEGAPTLALVEVFGEIVRGEGGAGLGGGRSAGGDAVARALRAAVADGARAVVLRIDSPGGSVVASETIRDAVREAKERGVLVVASMGTLAASGGYWIAADADLIVAQPGTITGSIGVLAGKFQAAGLWERLGVAWGATGTARQAGAFGVDRAFTAAERTRLDALVGALYDEFVAVAAEGRGRPEAEIRAVAGGRVWTGRQAAERGLVDRLGGQAEALDEARRRLGWEGRPYLLAVYPKPKGPLEGIAELLRLGGLAEAVAPALRHAAEAAAALPVGAGAQARAGVGAIR